MKTKLLICLLILVSCRLAGQSPTYAFVHISRDQGLTSNDVYDICQDEEGFYWICTDNGLQRYDGKRWIGAGSGLHPFLPDRPVKQAVISGKNELLLKFGNEYGIYSTNDFSLRLLPPGKQCIHHNESFLWKSAGGKIFCVCKSEGLLLYDPVNNEFGASTLIKVPDSLGINTVYEDTVNNHYWLGGENGIVVYDRQKGETYTNEHNPLGLPFLDNVTINNVSSVFIDGKQNYWIVYGSDRQTFLCYNEKEKRYTDQTASITSAYKGHFRIDQFFYTPDAGLWLYGKNALFNYMHDKGTFLNNKSDIINQMGARFNQVRRIFQDSERGAWIATDQGIYEYYTAIPPVRTIVLKTENDDNSITDVEEIGEGQFWISRLGKGIRALDSAARKIDVSPLAANLAPAPARALNNITNIHYSRRTQKIWLLSQDGHLFITDPDFRSRIILKPGLLAAGAAPALAEDRFGNMWLATTGGKIIRYDILKPLIESNFEEAANIKANVARLIADNYSGLWVCTTDNGLFEIDLNTRRLSRHFHSGSANSSSLTSNTIRSLVRLNDTICMVATDVLNVINLRTQAVYPMTFNDGLAGNTIAGMEADGQGNLWIATSNGVCRYNFSRNKFTAYGEKDGFIEFETIGTSSKYLSNGNILFAGSNLLAFFSPKAFNEPVVPPSVTITDIKIIDSFIRVGRNLDNILKLSSEANSISFYFSAMSYLQKDKLSYYYRLQGLENSWTNAGHQMAAIYSRLPSGEYTFQVRCENEEGITSSITGYRFFIAPPFWKTWWFIAVICCVVAGVLYVFYRLKLKRIIALSELREKVARDLHDDVGSTLSTISILSEIAKGKLGQDTAQAEKYIGRISDNSQQMMEAMDDIVWSIKPMNDSMQRIIARMREVASAALEPKNIDIDFYVDERVPELKLDMESRRDLFLVFKEAVNNIAKYSQCTHVGIYLNYTDRKLELKIRDNGAGFDLDTADSGNGISNMKKRAAMLNGNIRWHSGKDQGTQVQLVVPVK